MKHDVKIAQKNAAPVAALRTVPSFTDARTDARQVADAIDPDAPLMLFSAAALVHQLAQLRAAFPGDVTFAVKANSAPEVLTALAAANIAGFDVASPSEIEAVRRIAPAARLNYHNPVKSRFEIARAYRDHGVVRFAADDLREIEKILGVTGDDPNVEIAVRFRLPNLGAAVHDFSTKFGCDPSDAAELLRFVGARGLKPILTFHPGSQCRSPDAYRRHIEAAAGIARAAGVRLAILNTGGGLPVAYRGMDVPDLRHFMTAIANATRNAFAGDDLPRLECEPGRALAAPCMSLLTRVKLVKASRREVFLNDGIYGALMEVAQVPALCPPYRALRTEGQFSPDMAEFTAFGPTCDPLDRLPMMLRLPDQIAEGDYIEFGQLGAYGAVMATRFNGYGAAKTVPVLSVLTCTQDRENAPALSG